MSDGKHGLRPCAVAFAVAFALGLSGCGGGGGGGGGANVRPTPPQPIGGSDFTGGTVNVDAGNTTVWPADIGGSIDLVKGGAGTLVLTGTDSYTGGTTISAGALQLGNGGTTGWIVGDVTDNGSLVFDRSDNVSFAGVVSGSGSLTQAGTGTLILTGNNTYTGGTTISAGTLQLGNGGTTGWIVGDVADNGSLVFDRSDNVSFAGVVSGSGSLTQAGTGRLTLTGNNTYTGGTTISAGTLQLGNGGTTGWIVGDVTDNGSLVFDRSDDVSFAGVVSGSGSLTQAGTGTLTLTGSNAYTGVTTVSAGTLALTGSASVASSSRVNDAGTFDISGTSNGTTITSLSGGGAVTLGAQTLTLSHAADTFDGVISGTGGLTLAGGSEILTGANTYSGTTTISAGTLQLGNGGTTGWIVGDVADNGSLVFDRSDNVSFNGVISGSGALLKIGNGSLVLSGSNTYSGGTTVGGGTLEIASSASLGTGNIRVGSDTSYYPVQNLQVDGGVSISRYIQMDGYGTLDNAGKLGGTLDTAVGGSSSSAEVSNHNGGSILGLNAGIMLGIYMATIKNSSGGVIEGGNVGVGLGYGGTITNDGAGTSIGSPAGRAIQVTGNAGWVTNTGGATITGGTTAIYLQDGGSVTNGSGSIIQTTGTATGDCGGTGDCAIYVASSNTTPNNFGGQLTLTNAGTIIGNVQMIPTAGNSVTLAAGSSIHGDLDIGYGSLTLTGAAGTTQLYSQAVTGKTTFVGGLVFASNGTWIIDNDDLAPSTTSVDGGTLQVGNGGTTGSIGSGAVTIYHGSLVFDRSDNIIFNASISSGNSAAYDGTLVKAGTGTLTLTNNIIAPTNILIQSGTLQIGNTGGVSGFGNAVVSSVITNNGTLIFDSNLAIWQGPISGTGSVTQEGSAPLILEGANTYSGGTSINGSVLQATNVLPGNVTIGQAGALDGYSGATLHSGVPGVAGDLANAGRVLVHAGDTGVGGNYTQASTGTLAVSLGSKLAVTGTATLNGGTLEVTGADSGYVANTHTDVLTATGGLTGTFAQLVKDTGVVFTATTIQYDANSAWLDTTGLNVTTAAAGTGVSYTPTSMRSALRVQAAFEQIDSKIATNNLSSVPGDFLHAAGQFQQAPTLQAAQASLQSLSGELHAASAAMTFEAIDASSRALSDRFDSLLGKRSSFGVWTQSLDVGGDMARTGYDGVGFQLNGWLVGSDREIGHSGVAGFAFGQSQGRQQADQGFGRDNNRSTESMVYAGWLNGNWYTQGRVGFGHFQQDVNRQILLGYSAQGVSTQYSGNYGVAYGESGLYLNYGGNHITPFVDVEYASIDRGGFAEQGAGGFGLRSGTQALDRWQSGLGVRADRRWDLGDGRAVNLGAHAQWQRTLASHGDVFDASFVGLQQWQPLTGIGLSRYSTLFGFKLDATLSPRTALNFGYDYEMGQRVSAQMLSARLNVAF